MSLKKNFLKFATGLALVLLLVSLFGCKDAATDPFAFADAPFTAAISGVWDGKPVEVQLFYHGKLAEGGEEDRPLLTVSYRAPESLRGLTVTLFEDHHTEARLGESQKRGDYFYAVAPFLSLLPDGRYDSIKREGEKTVVKKGNLTYRFERGVPVGVSGEMEGRVLDLVVISLKQLK